MLGALARYQGKILSPPKGVAKPPYRHSFHGTDHISRCTVALPPASNSYSSPHFQTSGKKPSSAQVHCKPFVGDRDDLTGLWIGQADIYRNSVAIPKHG